MGPLVFRVVCWRAVWEAMDVTEDGVSDTALLVMKSFHQMARMRLWHVMWVFLQKSPGFGTVKAYCQDTCSVDHQLRSKTQPVLMPDIMG